MSGIGRGGWEGVSPSQALLPLDQQLPSSKGTRGLLFTPHPGWVVAGGWDGAAWVVLHKPPRSPLAVPGQEGQSSLPLPPCRIKDKGFQFSTKCTPASQAWDFRGQQHSRCSRGVRGGGLLTPTPPYFPPLDVSASSILKPCDGEAWADRPTETLMFPQASSARCRDAGKMGQPGFRAKNVGGVWGVRTRDQQAGLEQEGLETLSQLPGGLDAAS